MRAPLPTRRIVWNTLLAALIVAAIGVSWRITRVDFVRLFRDAGKGRDIVLAFLTPDLVARGVETTTVSVPLPIPCGSAPEAEIPASGPRLVPSVKCAE